MHYPNKDSRAEFAEEFWPITDLQPYKNNARTHSKKQLRQIADSIERFGFTNPVLVTADNMIIAGHGRVEAAKLLGMSEVPVRRLAHLNKDEVRAYILADNRIAENAGWDKELLALEFEALINLDFDIELLGFSTAEIDLTIDGFCSGAGGANHSGTGGAAGSDPVLDQIEPVASGPAITQPGDLWLLGPHRLLCGDARSVDDVARVCGFGASGNSTNGKALNDGSASYSNLSGGRTNTANAATLLFTDPPYNVKIDGHVSGLGRNKHREFAHASGEMDEDAFTAFLTQSLNGDVPSTLSPTRLLKASKNLPVKWADQDRFINALAR